VSARVDLFPCYLSPFPRSIMVEQDATQLLLKYYCVHAQAKAAFGIGGSTLHSMFSLPVNPAGSAFRSLSHDLLNNLRFRFSDLKVLIIQCFPIWTLALSKFFLTSMLPSEVFQSSCSAIFFSRRRMIQTVLYLDLTCGALLSFFNSQS